MAEQEHTPGPWELHDRYDLRQNPCGIDVTDAEADLCICRIPDGATVNGGHTYPHQLANARRIVACVNACEGISTEALEQGVLVDAVNTAKLLAAVTEGRKAPYPHHALPISWARSAVAKLRGGLLNE